MTGPEVVDARRRARDDDAMSEFLLALCHEDMSLVAYE